MRVSEHIARVRNRIRRSKSDTFLPLFDARPKMSAHWPLNRPSSVQIVFSLSHRTRSLLRLT